MRKTLYEVLKEKFAKKPVTDEEIIQLKKELESEKLKAEIRKAKAIARGEGGSAKFSKVMDDLFGKTQDVKTPRF